MVVAVTLDALVASCYFCNITAVVIQLIIVMHMVCYVYGLLMFFLLVLCLLFLLQLLILLLLQFADDCLVAGAVIVDALVVAS